MQVYMVPALLTLAADTDVAVWKGLILLFCLFVANTVWTVTYAVVVTLGIILGLWQDAITTLRQAFKTLMMPQQMFITSVNEI